MAAVADILPMLILLCLLPLALAEPPVGDSYLEAAQFSQGLVVDTAHLQYLPPDLTVPSARTLESFNTNSNQYLPPSGRTLSQEYGPPGPRYGLSNEYGLPTRASPFRSEIPQKHGAPIATHSSQHNSPTSNPIQSYSQSSVRTGVSQSNGTPSFRTSPSSLYGAPSLRSSPSSQYGAPDFRSSNRHTHQTSPVQKYGVPSFRSSLSHSRSIAQEYGTPTNDHFSESRGHSDSFSLKSQRSQFQRSKDTSQIYGTPARSVSTQYGIPRTRSGVNNFGLSTNTLQSTYGVPNRRNFNQDKIRYGTPNHGISDLNTNAFTSTYPSTRSPSLEYGAPTTRVTIPSQEYGVPRDSLTDQGYEYARNALDLLNQEPANYEFGYKVNDDESGSDFGHKESRQLDRAEGAYFVLLPDGTRQVVEYEADEDGFKPRISVETDQSATAFAADGPY